jgi:membrane protease YdiL (CAAX protease family)
MSEQRVREETVATVLAYLAAVAVLWFWPAPPLTLEAVLLIGLVVVLVVTLVVEWFAFKRTPRDMFNPRFRPLRYSLPAVPALFGASVLFEALAATDRPDRWVLAIAGPVGLILMGATVSNWWWAHATDTTSHAAPR